nr:uncharacterized protein LOC129279247 [Lytechinus pictus]
MAIGMLRELSWRSELVKIIERLPFHLKSRLVRHVKSIRDVGRQPTIQDAVNFITDAADELNDPVFGALLTGGPKSGSTDKVKTMSGRGQVSVFTTSANPSTQNCIMCSTSHDLFGSQEFKNMNLDDRFDFAFKKRLCFNCLLPGHISSRYNINRTCSVKGCDQKHTKFLHTGRRMTSSPQRPTLLSTSDASTQTDSDVSSHVSCGAMWAGVSRIALPIVPFTVSVPGEVG